MIAAVIILAIISGVLLYIITLPPLGERTFQAYYEQESFRDLTRGDNLNSTTLFKSAIEKFNSKDFRNASKDLDSFLIQSPNNEDAHLMAGISQLEIEDFESAVESFKTIPNTSGKYDIAVWYLGLSYLKLNNLGAAKIEFIKLTDGSVNIGPERKRKAEKILEALE